MGDIDGRIRGVHLASVSIVTDDGNSWDVSHERLLESAARVLDAGGQD